MAPLIAPQTSAAATLRFQPLTRLDRDQVTLRLSGDRPYPRPSSIADTSELTPRLGLWSWRGQNSANSPTRFTSEHANDPNFPPKVHEVVTEKAVFGRSSM